MITTSVAEAAQILQQGKVLAYPTEAVWGLGCDPFNEQAFLEILRLKQRPIEKG
ncbi:MAG: Sua5/YciO/YrdC/YwlC family protein, partial [Acinetobacter sp.]|nr:Sua5/YciO/YrdC/YwlC family protein [Acinetobacter sp.]